MIYSVIDNLSLLQVSANGMNNTVCTFYELAQGDNTASEGNCHFNFFQRDCFSMVFRKYAIPHPPELHKLNSTKDFHDPWFIAWSNIQAGNGILGPAQSVSDISQIPRDLIFYLDCLWMLNCKVRPQSSAPSILNCLSTVQLATHICICTSDEQHILTLISKGCVCPLFCI